MFGTPYLCRNGLTYNDEIWYPLGMSAWLTPWKHVWPPLAKFGHSWSNHESLINRYPAEKKIDPLSLVSQGHSRSLEPETTQIDQLPMISY